MEGAHPNVPGVCTNHSFDPGAHFTGGLIGEGQCHNIEGINIMMPDEMGDAVGEHPCLPGTGPGDDQGGAVSVYHTFTLGVAQLVKIGACHFIVHGCKLQYADLNMTNENSSNLQPESQAISQ